MKLIQEPITLPERYTVAAIAVISRDAMVHAAQEIQSVTTPDELALAAGIGTDLQKEIKAVAGARLDLAKPLNEAAKRLIALENEHCAPLLAEKDRLGRLVTAFQVKERQRVEAEERARQEELRRLDLERRQAEAKAERARKPEVAVKHEQRAYEAAEAANQLIRAPLPVASKASGTATRKKLCWRCSDVAALYAARPDLCLIEPKPSAILATCDPSRPVPGLELWFEDRTSFRS